MKIKYIDESDLVIGNLRNDSHKAAYMKNMNMEFAKECSLKLKISDPKIAYQAEKLYEFSATRVMQWMNKYDIATITAFRHKLANIKKGYESLTYMKVADKNGNKRNIESGEAFTTYEKRRRNAMLKLMLLKKRYGVTSIHNNWIEGLTGEELYEVVEESFFVANLNNDPQFLETLFKLSEWFNQDSVLFKLKNNSKVYLKGTNADKAVGYGLTKLSGELTFLPSKLMSRIRNAAFAFADKGDYCLFPSLCYENAHKRNFNECLLWDWGRLTTDEGVELDEVPYGFTRQAFGHSYSAVVGDGEPEGF